jgi:hypothetical protein
MPKLDAFETAMPISLIRQHIGWGHWFDRSKLTQKNINNTQYVACMNPTAGSFIINPRLQRLFMTLAMDFPGQDSLMKIYGTFLQVRARLPLAGGDQQLPLMGKTNSRSTAWRGCPPTSEPCPERLVVPRHHPSSHLVAKLSPPPPPSLPPCRAT